MSEEADAVSAPDPVDALADVDDLYDTAVEILDRLTGDDGDEEAAAGERIATDLDLLVDVAVEAVELLSAIDVETFFENVDVEELPEAVSFEELPEALADGNPKAAVNVSKLVQLVNLSALLTETDLQRTREEYAELEEAVDAFTDDGLVQTDDEGDGDGDDEFLEDSLFGGDEETSMVKTEVSQAVIQSELMDAIEEFRRGILVAHRELDRMRKYNEKRFRQRASSTSNSRNPTARSFIPSSRPATGASRFSTVPTRVRHSDMEGLDRIYGRRFDEEVEK
ncbi:hypothetical protein [Haloprofundus sp. MHR1]|uniref:hypothetical protein n=1 Tax=Haloprofundus sp. MHR1 TaxID=2572921 RepID=UPI0010BF0620|nr:hypothetical protein [Haloprofundus sp. MHR1]QCJ47358.1 hypothetical protein FCF25_09625 [Haloprofundus sp. MHR1]